MPHVAGYTHIGMPGGHIAYDPVCLVHCQTVKTRAVVRTTTVSGRDHAPGNQSNTTMDAKAESVPMPSQSLAFFPGLRANATDVTPAG